MSDTVLRQLTENDPGFKDVTVKWPGQKICHSKTDYRTCGTGVHTDTLPCVDGIAVSEDDVKEVNANCSAKDQYPGFEYSNSTVVLANDRCDVYYEVKKVCEQGANKRKVGMVKYVSGRTSCSKPDINELQVTNGATSNRAWAMWAASFAIPDYMRVPAFFCAVSVMALWL